MTQRKNPWIAMALSLIYPGLGHAYLGEMGRGLLYITIHSFLLFVGLISLGFLGAPALIFWIIAIIRSYLRAEKINKGNLTPEFQTARSALFSFCTTVLVGLIPIYVFPFSTYFSLYDRLPSEKAEVQTYMQKSLEKKYSHQVQVRKVEFSSDAGDMSGDFGAEAILIDYPDIPFRVSVYGEDSLQQPVQDTFVEEYIQHRHGKEYEERIQLSLEKAGFSHSKIWVNGIGTKEATLDIERMAKNPESYIKVSISTIKFMDYNQTKKQQLSQEIWTVIEPIHQLGIEMGSFSAVLYHPNWNTTSFNRNQMSNQLLAQIHIEGENPIHSIEDVIPYIKSP